jgi:hypothetical protein
VTSTSALEGRAERVRPQPDHTFRASHFFVLASLMAATAAVVASRQSSPAHLVLVSLVIGAAGLAAAGFYRMLSPLVSELSAPAAEAISGRARQVLEREKLLTLRALKDLEFDRSMGRMSQADFDEMTARLRARAVALIKQLDEDGSGYRSLIERELAARLASQKGAPAAPAIEPVEEPTLLPGVCPCGTANDPDAIFCKRCGARLQTAGAATS